MPPTPVFLPGKFHAQESLVGYSPNSHKESDMTEHDHGRMERSPKTELGALQHWDQKEEDKLTRWTKEWQQGRRKHGMCVLEFTGGQSEPVDQVLLPGQKRQRLRWDVASGFSVIGGSHWRSWTVSVDQWGWNHDRSEFKTKGRRETGDNILFKEVHS